ncbi:hypothetical protein Q8F55_008145 [Vanrija albida]|uniref:TauD/TfdA-like domain-containing protein n=1 Tax=Vanrija albida TaxID=181172 RepID=A0ABR3PVF7_9TREE
MAPIAVPTADAIPPAPVATDDDLAAVKEKIAAGNVGKKSWASYEVPPDSTIKRYLKAGGIDLYNGYPAYRPADSVYDDVVEKRVLRGGREFVDPGTRADPEKKALFAAAKEVITLTKHIGTELVGVQLKDLDNKQRDELALLIAERGVVFFRDQDLSPQKQLEIGKYLGDGEVFDFGTIATVPSLGPGITIIWEKARSYKRSYRLPWPEYNGYNGQGWHIDGVAASEQGESSYTHLHQDAVPNDSGDTTWASGYAAYDKLSPGFKKFVDGLTGIYKSNTTAKNSKNPDGPRIPKFERAPLVRTHPVTKWKTLFVADRGLVGIEGFDKTESEVIIKYLVSVYNQSQEIAVRFKWTPGTSAIWDNRVTNHAAVRDFDWSQYNERHGTNVISVGSAKPVFDPNSKSRGEALGIEGWLDPALDTERWFELYHL